MTWLHKLNYKYGRYYIRNLMLIVIIGMAVVFFADMFSAYYGFYISSYLSLDSAAILRGQVWRLITFIFVPPHRSYVWLAVSLYLYYSMGRNLEAMWSGFKLNIYYLTGILGAIAGTFVCHFILAGLSHSSNVFFSGTSMYLNMSLFLAFATLVPDAQFSIFFVISIKAKWMAAIYAAFIFVPVVQALTRVPIVGLLNLILLLFSLANYALFFGPSLVAKVKESRRIAKNRRNWQNRNR